MSIQEVAKFYSYIQGALEINKEDLNKLRDTQCAQIGITNIGKKVIPLKLIYECNTVQIKIPTIICQFFHLHGNKVVLE